MVTRVLGSLVALVLARGIWLWLAANGIHPEVWVAQMLGMAQTAPFVVALPWIFVGAIGLLGLFFGDPIYRTGKRLMSKKGSDKAVPTMRVDEVLMRVVGSESVPTILDREAKEFRNAANAVREKSLGGLLSTFGCPEWRMTRPEDYDHMVKHPIASDFWRTRQLDMDEFLSSHIRCGHTRRTDGLTEEGYRGIWFDRREVDAIWPETFTRRVARFLRGSKRDR